MRAAFAEQTGFCERLGSPLTATLCRLIGERLDASTEVGLRILGWPGDPSAGADGLPLRLCGGLHALVRLGAAPDLAACYPPNALPDDEIVWERLRSTLADEALLPWLDRPPQTNDVGRSAVLMAGLLVIGERFGCSIELLELGASAGLNLVLDRYAFSLGGQASGDPDSPLRLEPLWRGPSPPAAPVRVQSRGGVDLQPMDVRRDGERLLAYVWPDQRRRLEQVERALALAAPDPPRVDPGDAADWLEARLAEPHPPGVVRVVLHSVAFQYFPAAAQARIEGLVAAAGTASDDARPLAWLRYERLPGEKNFSLRLRTWPGHGDELLAFAHAHGAWVEWLKDRAR